MLSILRLRPGSRHLIKSENGAFAKRDPRLIFVVSGLMYVWARVVDGNSIFRQARYEPRGAASPASARLVPQLGHRQSLNPFV